MKKKLINGMCCAMSGFKKMLMIMKIVVFLVLFSVMSTNASDAYSQKKQVKISVKSATLESVLKEIRNKSEYTFFYYQKDIKGISVSNLNVNSTSIQDILDKVLKDTGMEYVVEDDVVIITPQKVINKQDNSWEINGKVVDEKGNPIPGVTVLIKGTKVGTASDKDGNFKFLVEKNDILVISFIGMKTREIQIKENKFLIIKLEEEFQTLDEVIVNTGYEKIDRRKLTSSVYVVKGEDVIEPVSMTIDQMLQGKIPGMIVTNRSSTPGVAAKVRIRGNSTILGNREPLWVVDGVILSDPVPIDNSELNRPDYVNLIGNAISFLNPQDIDNITVLKDAASTALYGSRAANGVIVITTKKGTKGKLKINYSLTTNLKIRPDYNDYRSMNSNQRIDLSEEIAEKGLNIPQGSDPLVGYERLLNQFYNKDISYDTFQKEVYSLRKVNTDWFDNLLRSPLSQNHNISINGGSDRSTYYVSGSFSDDQGMQLDTESKRYTLNANFNFLLSKKLKIDLRFNGAMVNNDRTHSSVNLMETAFRSSRAIKLYNNDGSLYFYPKIQERTLTPFQLKTDYIGYNVLHELEHTGNRQQTNNLGTNLSLEYKIRKNLRLNTQISYNTSNTLREEWEDEQSYNICSKNKLNYGNIIKLDDSSKGDIPIPYGGLHNFSQHKNETYSGRVSFNYNKNFNRDNLYIMCGGELNSSKYNGYTRKTPGYFPNRGKSFANNMSEIYEKYRQNLDNKEYIPKIVDNTTNSVSVFASATYSINNKYTLNTNIRADGSNKFGQDKDARFLPIWSISGRWNIYQEPWADKYLGWLFDNLSVKASYGIQGQANDQISPNLILKQGGFSGFFEEFENNFNKFPNTKLRWEKTTSMNLGVEFSAIKNFISGSFEMYHKRGTDQIISRTVTQTNGADSYYMNSGTVINKGWDLALTFNVINTKYFNWSFSTTAGKYYNDVEDTENPDIDNYESYLNGSVIRNGKSINTFYSYRFAGLDEMGMPMFEGVDFLNDNYEGEIQTKEDALASALVSSGKKDPVFQGSFNTGFTFKNIIFSGSISYSLGNKIRLFNLYEVSGNNIVPYPLTNVSDEFVNRWKKPGDEKHTNIPVLTDQRLYSREALGKYNISSDVWQMYNNGDHRVVSGNYFKLSNISIGYNIPEKYLKQYNIKSCSILFGCANGFTICSSKLNGQNPESFGGVRALPPQDSYTLTLNLSF